MKTQTNTETYTKKMCNLSPPQKKKVDSKTEKDDNCYIDNKYVTLLTRCNRLHKLITSQISNKRSKCVSVYRNCFCFYPNQFVSPKESYSWFCPFFSDPD